MNGLLTTLLGNPAWQTRQEGLQNDQASALQFAKLSPFEKANYSLGMGARGMVRGIGDMTGMMTAEEADAARKEAVMGSGDVDLTTSAGTKAKAEQFRQAGDIRTATALLLRSQELAKQEKATALEERKITAKETLEYAQAAKALRENPNLATVEVGVKDKPGWTQMMIYDKADPSAPPTPVGEPKQSAAAMRISVGGGESKQMLPYIDPQTGRAVYGAGNELRGKVVPTYDPVTKQLVSSAASQGTGEGKEAAAIGGKIDAADSLTTAKDMYAKGIYTGAYAKAIMAGNKYLPGTDKTKVANTEAFLSHIGNVVIPRLQEFGGNDSEEELKYLRNVMAGDVTLEGKAIENILEAAERKINRGIQRARKLSVESRAPSQSNAPKKPIKFGDL